MSRRLICICCPQGCLLTVSTGAAKEWAIDGNRCPKGITYALQEMTNPMRIVTSTVKTAFKDIPRVSVRTDGEIPKDKIFDLMKFINGIELKERKIPGEILVKDILGLGVALIITSDSVKSE